MNLRSQYPVLRRSRVGAAPGLRGARINGPSRTGSWGPTLVRLLAGALALLAVLAFVKLAALPLLDGVQERIQHALEPQPVPMPVPAPGTRTLRGPAVTVILVDDSGSMGESDPDDERYAAFSAYAMWMRRYARLRDRVAVVRFAKESTGSGRLFPATALAPDVRTLADQPEDGEQTLFDPAAERAVQALTAAPADAAITAVVISDGETPDAPRGLERLRRIADHIEVIAINRDGGWDSARSSWAGPGVRIHEARNQRPREIAAEIARAQMRLTGETADKR